MTAPTIPTIKNLEQLRKQLNTILVDVDARLPLTGEGTPEGAVEAAVGRLYTRTDGGASTTLYVKESGSGDTGWVAK
jgi:hypothetical protein